MQEKKMVDPLSASGLHVGYKTSLLHKQITFGAGTGELVAVVGRNGIGKSTLLRTLAGFQAKLAGDIYIQGQPMVNYKASQLAKLISVVLTEPIATKNLTVFEVVALGRQPYTNWLGLLTEIDKTKISSVLDILYLNDLAQTKCYALSDGQLQRVLIARALAQDTPIILLDEPTTHLDLYHKVQLLKLLQQTAHLAQKAIIYTTHDIEMSLQLCDKILILDGHKNSYGSPKELMEKDAFTKLFPEETVQFENKTGTFRIQK